MNVLKGHLLTTLLSVFIALPCIFFSVPLVINFAKLANEFVKSELAVVYKERTFIVSSDAAWSPFPPSAQINNLHISSSNKSDSPFEATIGKAVLTLKFLPLLFMQVVPTEIDVEWFSMSSTTLWALAKDFQKNPKTPAKVKFSNGLIRTSENGKNNASSSDGTIQLTKGELNFLSDGFSVMSAVTVADQPPYQVSLTVHGHDDTFRYKNFEVSIASQHNSLKIVGNTETGSMVLDITGEGKQLTTFTKDLLTYVDISYKKADFDQDDNFEINGKIIVSQDGSITSDGVNIKGEFIDAIIKFAISSQSSIKIDSSIETIDLDKELNFLKMLTRIAVEKSFATQSKLKDAKNEINISAKKLINQKLEASSLDLKLTSSNNVLNIEKASMLLPGTRNLARLSGNIIMKNGTPVLTATLHASGQDSKPAFKWIYGMESKSTAPFIINARLRVSPKIFIIPNVTVMSHDGILDAYLRQRSDGKSYYTFYDVNGSLVNFDNFNINFKKQFSLLNDQELDSMPWESSMRVFLKDSYKNSETLENISFSASLSPAGLSIRDIVLKGTNTDIHGEIYSEFNPQQNNKQYATLNIEGEKFNAAFLDRPQLLKVERERDSNKILRILWDDNPFDLSFITKTEGECHVKIKDVAMRDGNSLKNLMINTKVHRSTIILENFDFGLGGGLVELQGNLVSSKTESILNGVASVKSVPIPNLVSVVSGFSTETSGMMSANAKFSTYGKSILQMVDHTSGAANLVCAGANIHDLNIDGFFRSIFVAKSESEIENLSQIGLYDGTTFFPKMTIKTKFSEGKLSGVAQASTTYASIASSFLVGMRQLEATGVGRFFFVPPGRSSISQTDTRLSGYPWDLKIGFSSKDLYKIVSGEAAR